MERTEVFEALLEECRSAVERTVFFRISRRADAEDVLQEVYMSAYHKFDTLMDPLSFKAWIVCIARNKCVDYYRKRASETEHWMEIVTDQCMTYGRCGLREQELVRDTLALLAKKDQRILRLHYFEEVPQEEIAKKLQVPLGTVKSRLHAARENFRVLYPEPPRRYLKKEFQEQLSENGSSESHLKEKEENMVKNSNSKLTGDTVLPDFLPKYCIVPSAKLPFKVVWEELQGWMIVPRLGESLTWGLYGMPSQKRMEYAKLTVTGRAQVHGIEGVEIVAIQYDAQDYYRTGSVNKMERRFVAQLTDTHSRYLAESHVEDGVRKCYTFLDGDSFMKNWGFGEDNCGNETHVAAKGILQRIGNTVNICEGFGQSRPHMDVVGRYTVDIAEKKYDTICVMDVESFDDAIVTESYIDQNGRTVLWRRFNRDDWAVARFGIESWSKALPDNERLTVDGKTYVHWYDCISEYIL
ncbi:MAG: RNA polymerase sigma factor [Lachnospiraceae bacterium]|nr:RNA polymerase sigma factor [Lachnospiraceae bacterium]